MAVTLTLQCVNIFANILNIQKNSPYDDILSQACGRCSGIVRTENVSTLKNNKINFSHSGRPPIPSRICLQDMETPTIIPSHTVAHWLLTTIDNTLDALGMGRHRTTEEIIYLVAVSIVAFAVAWIIKKIIFVSVRKLVKMRKITIGLELLQWHTLRKVCQIIPPLILLALVPFAFESTHSMRFWIFRIVGIYGLVALGIALGAVFDFAFNHYNIHQNKRNLPLRGLLNVAKGILWIVLSICSVSLLLDKSPAFLLTGLGAFAAALMLIFKDSILGFVAGIQMSQNDMLHVGDWIVVPDTPANGVVMDMTLSTVKVRNFDNTIVTVPPYTLISNSFQNWRGMVESGGRRVMKSIFLDLNTIKFCTPEMLDNMRKEIPLLADYKPDEGVTPTNSQMFRVYVERYLTSLPVVNTDLDLIIRQLQSTEYGVPIQIYFFSRNKVWKEYERIQSDIFDHFFAMIPLFELKVYQYSD